MFNDLSNSNKFKKGIREEGLPIKRATKRKKEKLGLWRKEAKRNSEKNLERDFNVGNHHFRKTRGKGGTNLL